MKINFHAGTAGTCLLECSKLCCASGCVLYSFYKITSAHDNPYDQIISRFSFVAKAWFVAIVNHRQDDNQPLFPSIPFRNQGLLKNPDGNTT